MNRLLCSNPPLPPPSPAPLSSQGVTEAGLLASVCKRYRTVKTLFIKPPPARKEGPAPASSTAEGGPASDSSFVEITFAGPQPSENCGALLCLLLGGDSVQAWPVELPRGRKRKSAVSTEAADDAISGAQRLFSVFFPQTFLPYPGY